MNAALLAASLHLLKPTMPATDKIAHATLSADLVVACLDVFVEKKKHITWKQRVAASWITWQIGVLKETSDASHGGIVDWGDIRADLLGIGIGQAITWRF